jgi:Ser/Thr protein kinase RdoA (MazF antagonist)
VLSVLRTYPEVFADVGDPVCCHGWATPEHVATSDGEVVCLVDFEHAIAAPGEFDYWRTVTPTFGADESGRQAFREGYESVRALPAGFESRRRLYGLLNLVYYFESLYVQDQHDPDTTANKAEELRTAVADLLDTLSS